MAEAIVHCCQTPMREIMVGGGGKLMVGMRRWAPALFDVFMTGIVAKQQKLLDTTQPLAQNGLDHAAGRLQERGNYPGRTRTTSLYTTTALHPAATAAVVGLGLAAWLAARGNGPDGRRTQNRQARRSEALAAPAVPTVSGYNA